MGAHETFIKDPADGSFVMPATEETLQASTNKIPTYDLYISYNGDGSTNQKIWKQGAVTIKTLTYVYTAGNLTSKILS